MLKEEHGNIDLESAPGNLENQCANFWLVLTCESFGGTPILTTWGSEVTVLACVKMASQ